MPEYSDDAMRQRVWFCGDVMIDLDDDEAAAAQQGNLCPNCRSTEIEIRTTGILYFCRECEKRWNDTDIQAPDGLLEVDAATFRSCPPYPADVIPVLPDEDGEERPALVNVPVPGGSEN